MSDTPGAMAAEMATKSGEIEYVFDQTSNTFWKQVSPDEWIDLREVALRRDLKKTLGLREKADAMHGEKISQLDDFIRNLEQNKRVKRAALLAGYRCGVHEIEGERILVPRSLKLINPIKGEWPILHAVLERMFVGEEYVRDGQVQTIDQRDYWLAYMQHWLKSLYGGRITRGLCLAIAGDTDCGKTLLAGIMKEMTGRREGKPYDFMIGRDNFNQELFEATQLLIDDENADTHIEARKELAAHIKRIVANQAMKLRGMHRDGWNVPTTRRLVALLNIEAESLLVMPPLVSDIADKILMLKAYKRPRPAPAQAGALALPWPMPMATDTIEQQDNFWAALLAELPALVFFLLNEYAAPSPIAGGRFGVRAWQHPEILRELQHFSPHTRLWQLIERAGNVFRRIVKPQHMDMPEETEEVNEWKGAAEDLYNLLTSESNGLTRHERERDVKAPSWLGQQLKAAMADFGREVVDFKRMNDQRIWTLHRRKDLAE